MMAQDIIFNDMNWDSPRLRAEPIERNQPYYVEAFRADQSAAMPPRHHYKRSNSSGRTQLHSRQKSIRRPTTPVPSLVNTDTVSPPSIPPISPQSLYSHIPRTRNNSTATTHSQSHARPQQPRSKPPALKLERSFTKRDIGPPLPSPADITLDNKDAFQPHRPSPITPPGPERPCLLPVQQTEVSVMEWDDEHTSALSRVKQSFSGIRQKRSNSTPKSPDHQQNATPRPQLPQRSAPRKFSDANFSRPTRPQTSPQRYAVGNQTAPQYDRRPSAPVISTLSTLRRDESRRPSAATTASFDTDKMLPPTPTSTFDPAMEREWQEPDRPVRLHAFMKGLIERASRGNLRKDRDDSIVVRSTSPFIRLRGI